MWSRYEQDAESVLKWEEPLAFHWKSTEEWMNLPGAHNAVAQPDRRYRVSNAKGATEAAPFE